MPQAIRSFNRYELKFILDTDHMREVQEGLKKYLLPDKYGDKFGNYNLSSLYYDNDDFTFYWEKVEGLKFRRKLRIRHYETEKKLTPESKVFVEIKQRMDRVTQKRRVILPYEQALQLCDERIPPSNIKDEKDQMVIDEIIGMIYQYDLKPQCITSYQRMALVGSELDPGLRVTFDTNLRYRRQDLDLASKKLGPYMLDPDKCVLEIKVNDRIPYWLTEFAADASLSLVRISKYCTGLEKAELVPALAYDYPTK